MKTLIFFFVYLALTSAKECPGGTFQCPDSSTCCEMLDHTYGCCPLENAVCCDDHTHCCPQNTKCSAGMCVQNTNASVGALPLVGQDVVCPDKQSICPDETTCCKNPASGTYGCCPLEDAVCCEDGDHCCPTGTTCNLAESRCDGDGYVAQIYYSGKHTKHAFKKFIPLKSSKNVLSVVCPGSEFQCPNGYTCCKTASGQWGCCPFSDATCCKDGMHCCPNGMNCDPTSQYCSQGPVKMTSFLQLSAKLVLDKHTCPDNSTCNDQQTCCRVRGGYGCCLYENATCCSDLQHCCPANEECDVEQGRCIPKGRKSLESYFVNQI